MKRFAFLALAAAFLILGSSRAQASAIYTTYSFTFDFNQPGATATGTVTIEQDLDVFSLSSWNVVVSGLDDNGNPYPTVDFSNTAAGASGAYDPTINPDDPLFNLLQNDPLQLEWYTTFDCNNPEIQILNHGFFEDQNTGFTVDFEENGAEMTPTPEPATWTLLGGGLLVLLGLAWRQRKAGADVRA